MSKIFLRRPFVATIGILCLLAWTSPVPEEVINSHLDEQEEVIRGRLPSVVKIVNPVYNPAVRSYLNTYIYRRPDHTAVMLGWAAVYFPMFEKALEEEGLPTDLKYLSIVESALNPSAISRSGAGGLWQFMKPTARECGLKISSYVDERMDPEKATRAAAKYLKQLYGMFGNWELVMAAYNAGPGRVRSAVKRAGNNNYWEMSRYLPAETQSYVPGFIAASYLMNYHDAHNLLPVYPEHAMGELLSVYVYEGMSIAEVAKRSGLTIECVKRFNPAFVRNYIPSSPAGHALILPYAAAELFNSGRSLEAPGLMADAAFTESATVTIDGQSFKISTSRKEYIVRSGDNLYAIAQRYKCSVRELMTWNHLHDSRLAIGQRLEIRQVTRELIPSIVEVVMPVAARNVLAVQGIPVLSLSNLSIRQEKQAPFGIVPVVKDQSQNMLVLQRRQSVRQAMYQSQLNQPDGSSISPSFPSNLVPGDVLRLK